MTISLLHSCKKKQNNKTKEKHQLHWFPASQWWVQIQSCCYYHNTWIFCADSSFEWPANSSLQNVSKFFIALAMSYEPAMANVVWIQMDHKPLPPFSMVIKYTWGKAVRMHTFRWSELFLVQSCLVQWYIIRVLWYCIHYLHWFWSACALVHSLKGNRIEDSGGSVLGDSLSVNQSLKVLKWVAIHTDPKGKL